MKFFLGVLAAVMGLMVAFLYAPAVQGPFLLDDFPVIVENPSLAHPTHLKEIFAFDPSRFLSNVTFAWNRLGNGSAPRGFRLVNLFLHCVNGLVVFALVWQWGALPRLARFFVPDKVPVALLTAVIFLVHPIQTSAVNYIVQRSVLLATLFMLGSLNFYLQARRRNCRRRLVVAWVLAVTGAFCKPIVGVLPLLILFIERVGFSASWDRNLLKRLAAFGIVSGLVVVLTLSAMAVEPGTAAQGVKTGIVSPVTYALTQMNVLMRYLQLWLIPVGQNLDYDFPAATGLLSFPTGCSLLAILLLILLAWRSASRHPWVSLGIGWFFITLSVESSVFPLPDFIFEHRMYAPAVGLSFLTVMTIFQLSRRDAIRYGLSVVLIMIFSALTLSRNWIWADAERILWDTASKSPDKPRVLNALGSYYFRQGEWEKALAAYQEAMKRDASYAEAWSNRGNVFLHLGLWDRALADFDQAIQRDPLQAKAYLNRAVVFLLIGNLESARTNLDRAGELAPRDAEVYFYWGNYFRLMGEIEAAEAAFSRAIALDPGLTEAYFNRGLLAWHFRQDRNRAVQDFQRALQIDPDHQRARQMLEAISNQGGGGSR